MPITNYSVLKGDPVSGKVVAGNSPHYQITVQAEGGPFTVAVNIQSVDGSEVLYTINQAFTPPDPAGLLALATGMNPLASEPGGLAIDYVRSTVGGQPMVEKSALQLLPETGPGQSDLHNAVVDLFNSAVADPGGTIYAFGSSFADNGEVDGIHDIHMNQGNPLNSFGKDNGIWQDGAVFMNLPAQNAWVAVFIAFQTESWNTDDSGNPV